MSDQADDVEWEWVRGDTQRLPVPGGWLYLVMTPAASLVFVPDHYDGLWRIADALEEISTALDLLTKAQP